jgi:hypothetical protein
MTRARLEQLHRELVKLLSAAESAESDNPEGTYLPEYLLALHLARLSVGRAVNEARRCERHEKRTTVEPVR